MDRVAEVVRQGRLRWFGYLEHKNKDEWISSCRNIEIEDTKNRGRSRKTWDECVRQDLDRFGLKKEMAQDRRAWKGLIKGEPFNLC